MIVFASAAFGQQLGDVNSNGVIDIIDALRVAQYYVGMYSSPFSTTAADVNCSGSADIVDALMIAQYYVGLRTGFTCPTSVPTTVPTVVPTADPTIVPTPVPGEGQIAISLVSSGTIYPGDQFTMNIYVNSGDKRLSYYEFYIYYDSSAIAPDPSYGLTGVAPGR